MSTAQSPLDRRAPTFNLNAITDTLNEIADAVRDDDSTTLDAIARRIAHETNGYSNQTQAPIGKALTRLIEAIQHRSS